MALRIRGAAAATVPTGLAGCDVGLWAGLRDCGLEALDLKAGLRD